MKRMFLVIVQSIFTLFLYVLGAGIIAIALLPAVYVVTHVGMMSNNIFILCLSLAIGYFIFGFSLMLTVGVLNTLLQLRLKEGVYKVGHPETLKWFFVNALFLCVRTVFMDFVLLTPFCSLFYRLMGAKLGIGVQINSKNVADLSLLEIGDGTVIGGNATVIGHLFEPKGLKLMPIKIGRNVVIGLNAVIMPGCQIGDKSVVAAGAIVPKNTIIPPNTIYYSPEKFVTRTEHQH